MMVGANVEELDALAVAMSHAHGGVSGLRVRLDAAVHAAPWHGHEADQFRADWAHVHRPRLIAAELALEAAAGRVRRNAQQQRATSASDGSGLAPHPVRPGTPPAPQYGIQGYIDTLPPELQAIIRSGGDIIETAFTTAGGIGLLKDLLSVGAVRAVPGVGDLLALGWDSVKLGDHLARHDTNNAMWDAGHVALDVVGTACPTIGAWIRAYQFGWATGMLLDHKFHISEHVGNFIVPQMAGVHSGVSPDQMTPQQSHDLVQRYSGWSAPWHMAVDAAQTPAVKWAIPLLAV